MQPMKACSFSAPKVLGCNNSPVFRFNLKTSPKISPGESPSCFAISNIPLPCSKRRDFFFSSDMPLTDLIHLAEISPIAEEADEQVSAFKNTQVPGWRSASFKTNLSPSLNNASKNDENTEDSQLRGKKQVIFVPITMPMIILQKPPVRPGNVKREKRGQFNEELISYDRYSGVLKFYNLHSRFGFIKVTNEDFDAFICEDDLLLSGQNLRRFKDDAYKKKPVEFEFNIKKYLNGQGVEKMKAVNILIRCQNQ